MVLQVALSGEVLDVFCGMKLFPKQVPNSSRGASGCPACLPLLVCAVGPWCSLVVFRAAVGPGSPSAPRLCGWLCVQGRGAAGPAQSCS